MTLTKKIIHGIVWSGVSQFIRLFLQFGIISLLARLLSPDYFGLIAMVVVFTNFVMIFRDFGLSAALIQHQDVTEEHLSSTFWINIVFGLFLTFSLIALAPVIADFYSESRLIPITVALASIFFISSFGTVHIALLTKKILFKPLAIIEVVAVGISGAFAVALAFFGAGVWSLVYQQIISNLIMVILLWTFSSWKPKLLFRWYRFKELSGFGLNVTGFSFVNYFHRNLDNLLIGKFLGSTLLGFYNLAYQLLLFPITSFSYVVGRVIFPSLSAIRDDKVAVLDVYIKANRYIAILTFPLMVGLLVVAPQFIRVVFGYQWEKSIICVQILAIVGLIQSLSTLVGPIYQSQGRADIQFYMGIIGTVVSACSFIIGLQAGIIGVSVAYALVTLLMTYPGFAIPFRLINLKFRYFIKELFSIIIATCAMFVFILIIQFFMVNILKAGDLSTLISTVLVGVVSYFSILFILDKLLLREIFHFIKHLRSTNIS